MKNLPRPFVLLEGPGGATHLAWGAKSRRTLSWDEPADSSVLTPDGDTPLYGTIAYEFGLPPGVPRRQPAAPQPLVDLFEPENLLVLDAEGRVVRGQGPGVRELLDGVRGQGSGVSGQWSVVRRQRSAIRVQYSALIGRLWPPFLFSGMLGNQGRYESSWATGGLRVDVLASFLPMIAEGVWKWETQIL